MNESNEASQLAHLLQSLTVAGQYGLAVLSHADASEVAKADASALVDLTTRKLHEFVGALNAEDD